MYVSFRWSNPKMHCIKKACIFYIFLNKALPKNIVLIKIVFHQILGVIFVLLCLPNLRRSNRFITNMTYIYMSLAKLVIWYWMYWESFFSSTLLSRSDIAVLQCIWWSIYINSFHVRNSKKIKKHLPFHQSTHDRIYPPSIRTSHSVCVVYFSGDR